MDRLKLIEIQHYHGITEYYCKSCGVVLPVEDIQPVFLPSNRSYQVTCPDCDKHIAFLKQAKALRIFKSTAEGMVEINKIDRGWLRWALSINHTAFRKQEYREAANARIYSEDLVEVPDHWNNTAKRIKAIKRLDEIDQLIHSYSADRQRLTQGTEDLDYFEIQKIQRQGKAIGKQLEKLGYEKAELRKVLADDSEAEENEGPEG